MEEPVIRLLATTENDLSASATAKLQLSISGEAVRFEVTVPPGKTRLRNLLPVLQGLANAVVDVGQRKVERQGEKVSCCKGCGACCRQVVPISVSEAHAIAFLVRSMPEPRRTAIRARFAGACKRLSHAGLAAELQTSAGGTGAPLQALGLRYFQLGIACPFLEDESCSIHEDRPVACREYLVTSPAAACARPTLETVRMVPLPFRVLSAVFDLEPPHEDLPNRWLPLIQSLEWAELHPEAPPSQTGPEFIDKLLQRLSRDR